MERYDEMSEAVAAIQESLHSGYWVMRFDERAQLTEVIWSEPFRKMLGYRSKEDFPDVLESWTDLIHPDYKEMVMDGFWSSIRDFTGNTQYDYKYLCLTRNRGWRWFHDACRFVRRPDGSPEVLHGIFIDIDDQVKQEIALQEALQAAEAANRSKTVFLSNMSHDMRTPMNAIMGFASLAAEHINEPERSLDYINKIQVASNHLLSLINDVLDMSRIESGKLAVNEEPVHLPKLLKDIESILQEDAENKGISFDIEYSSLSDEDVYADRLRLNQILINLLGNAVKFTNSGGNVKLVVRESCSDRDEYGNFQFAVTDTGIGISEQFVSHVFEPFERERTSTVSGIPGAGLGLSITKSIVDAMGGTITLKSKQGVGSSFLVTLKLRICRTMDEVRGLPAVHIEQAADGKRILLAEDNELNREIAQEILSDIGYESEITCNGAEAVEALESHGQGYYDAVLMDIQMPVMDGYEATKRIRGLADINKAAIPIIAMTANAFEDDKRNAVRCGMNGHVAKPIDVKALAETLRVAIS